MAQQLTKDHADDNILRAAYKTDYGDLETIRAVGMPYLFMANWATHAYAFLSAFRHKYDPAKPSLPTPQFIADELFSPHIKMIAGAIDKHLSLCVSEAAKKIKERLDEGLLEEPDLGNYATASKHLHDSLKRQWFWYNWLVLVYLPVTVRGSHGVAGGQYRYYRFPFENKLHIKANIVITWYNPDDYYWELQSSGQSENGYGTRDVFGRSEEIMPQWYSWLDRWLSARTCSEDGFDPECIPWLLDGFNSCARGSSFLFTIYVEGGGTKSDEMKLEELARIYGRTQSSGWEGYIGSPGNLDEYDRWYFSVPADPYHNGKERIGYYTASTPEPLALEGTTCAVTFYPFDEHRGMLRESKVGH